MRYPVTLTPAPEGGYGGFFVDIPGSVDAGETVAGKDGSGKRCLLTAFGFCLEDNELIPPSPLNSHDHFIEVPLSVASKVLLLNAFLQSEITQQELAVRIGKPKQEITRLFNSAPYIKNRRCPACGKGACKELSLVMAIASTEKLSAFNN